jgi:hypothetical protein
VRVPLINNGLSVVQFPKGKCELETMLMHISGEWMSETFEMKPIKDDPQGAGSVITYQRRYALGAILSLNIDIDDDGNKGSDPGKGTGSESQKTDESKQKEDQMIITASSKLNDCKTVEDVKKVWTLLPSLQKNKIFIKMVSEAKDKLTPKTE